jgi:predicted RNase H-like HicB family nuclease
VAACRDDGLTSAFQAPYQVRQGHDPAPRQGSADRNSETNLSAGEPAYEVSRDLRYIAFIHKEPGSAYGVSFPDVPGCISAGDTIDEAVRNAVEALSGHVRMMEADGETVPEPRDFDAIMTDSSLAEDRAGAMTTVVPLVRDRGSTTRINVSVDLGLLEAIDAAARDRGQTRSAFLASAARREIID